MTKPRCYSCQHRRSIPGDAHSSCAHPETGQDDNYLTALAESFLGKSDPARTKLGIRGGGQTWPANFDPNFLTACNGFKVKNDD